jgi:hypothetical protein
LHLPLDPRDPIDELVGHSLDLIEPRCNIVVRYAHECKDDGDEGGEDDLDDRPTVAVQKIRHVIFAFLPVAHAASLFSLPNALSVAPIAIWIAIRAGSGSDASAIACPAAVKAAPVACAATTLSALVMARFILAPPVIT